MPVAYIGIPSSCNRRKTREGAQIRMTDDLTSQCLQWQKKWEVNFL